MTNQYKRWFIALKQDARGYGLKNREPSGRAVVEINGGAGKVSLWLQDLRPGSMYKIYLVATDGMGVSLGTVGADERGKAEHKFEVSENVAGSGRPLDDFEAVACIIPGKSELTAALVGFRGDEFDWKSRFKDFKEIKKEPLIAQASIAQAPKEPEPIVEPPKEILTQPELEMLLDEPLDVPPDDDEPSDEDIHAAFKEVIQKFTREFEDFKAEKVEAQQGETALEQVFRGSLAMDPFKQQSRDVKWVRASMKDMGALPIQHWRYANHPFMVSSYCRYRHLIFGRTPDGETYLGVPDVYDDGMCPTARRLGFMQFKCCGGDTVSDGKYGYWLMYIGKT